MVELKLLVFVITALAEIVGCYLTYMWLVQQKKHLAIHYLTTNMGHKQMAVNILVLWLLLNISA